MIVIQVRDAEGNLLAAVSHEKEAMLCVNRVYQPGDRLVIRGAERLFVQMDQSLSACEVFAPEGRMDWPVPSGEHRLAYAPGCFEAPRHVIAAREMEEEEIGAVRPNVSSVAW